jgi:hypothetical protein
MSRQKDLMTRLEQALNGWRTLAPAKSFGGMTLAQFEEACAPSKEMRVAIDELETRLAQAKNQRDAADDNTWAKIQLLVAGVAGDPTEGPDSALYEAIGYTRKSERKTGLTRKRTETPSE